MELEKNLEKMLQDGEELCLAALSCWLCAAACLRQKHCLLSRLVVQYKDYSLWWCPSDKTKATRQGFYWYMSNFTSSGFDWCEHYVTFLKERNERSPQFVASPGFFLLSGIPDGKQSDLLSATVVDLCGKSCMEKVCDNCALITTYSYRRQATTILGHCGASYAEQMAIGDWQQVTVAGSSGSSGRSALPARYTGQKELAAVYVKSKVLAIHQAMAKAGLRNWEDISPAMWQEPGSVNLDKPIDSTVIWRHPDAKPARALVLKPAPDAPRRTTTVPGRPQDGPRTAKTAPGRIEISSSGTQDVRNTPKDGPRRSQDSPNSVPW